jgi:hypothetical protein
MNPRITGRRRRVAALAALAALAFVGAACDDDAGDADGGEDVGVDLDLDAGEVRVIGEYPIGDPPLPGALIAMAVGADGTVYFRLSTGTVVDVTSPSDVDSCCAQPDLAPGGLFVDDAVYVTHGESSEPYRGVWRSPFSGGVDVVVDMPEARGQIPGDVAVGPDGEVIFTVRRAEEGSTEGIQVLRATDAGGFEVVAGLGEGCTTGTTPVAAARFSSLVGVAVGDDGTIYLADEGCDAVYAVADGSVRVVLSDDTAPGPGGLRPVDVAVIGDDVFIADRRLGDFGDDVSPDDGRVLRVDADGRTSVVLDDAGGEDDADRGSFNLSDVRSIAATPAGDLLVLDDDRVLGIGVGRE